jgi:hypothetical protein
MVKHKKCRIQDKFQACAFATSKPTSQNEFCRRDLLLFGLSSSFSIIFPSLGTLDFHLFSIFTVWMGKWVAIYSYIEMILENDFLYLFNLLYILNYVRLSEFQRLF